MSYYCAVDCISTIRKQYPAISDTEASLSPVWRDICTQTSVALVALCTLTEVVLCRFERKTLNGKRVAESNSKPVPLLQVFKNTDVSNTCMSK